MVSRIYYNLIANENFVILVTFKFIIYFIDIQLHALGFTLGMKSQSIAYSLEGSEDQYGIL